LPDEEVVETPFYRPPLDSRETQYLLERRRQLGGFVPNEEFALSRSTCRTKIAMPNL
jgi:pyruvate dehydrogenase E1 component